MYHGHARTDIHQNVGEAKLDGAEVVRHRTMMMIGKRFVGDVFEQQITPTNQTRNLILPMHSVTVR
jgi:hypothetical protein